MIFNFFIEPIYSFTNFGKKYSTQAGIIHLKYIW